MLFIMFLEYPKNQSIFIIFYVYYFCSFKLYNLIIYIMHILTTFLYLRIYAKNAFFWIKCRSVIGVISCLCVFFYMNSNLMYSSYLFRRSKVNVILSYHYNLFVIKKCLSNNEIVIKSISL